jgi:hypothetical protein
LCSGRRYFPYYSYRRNPTGREFFVPAGTLIAVKLLSYEASKICKLSRKLPADFQELPLSAVTGLVVRVKPKLWYSAGIGTGPTDSINISLK